MLLLGITHAATIYQQERHVVFRRTNQMCGLAAVAFLGVQSKLGVPGSDFQNSAAPKNCSPSSIRIFASGIDCAPTEVHGNHSCQMNAVKLPKNVAFCSSGGRDVQGYQRVFTRHHRMTHQHCHCRAQVGARQMLKCLQQKPSQTSWFVFVGDSNTRNYFLSLVSSLTATGHPIRSYRAAQHMCPNDDRWNDLDHIVEVQGHLARFSLRFVSNFTSVVMDHLATDFHSHGCHQDGSGYRCCADPADRSADGDNWMQGFANRKTKKPDLLFFSAGVWNIEWNNAPVHRDYGALGEMLSAWAERDHIGVYVLPPFMNGLGPSSHLNNQV
jgi:hypothetical protein